MLCGKSICGVAAQGGGRAGGKGERSQYTYRRRAAGEEAVHDREGGLVHVCHVGQRGTHCQTLLGVTVSHSRRSPLLHQHWQTAGGYAVTIRGAGRHTALLLHCHAVLPRGIVHHPLVIYYYPPSCVVMSMAMCRAASMCAARGRPMMGRVYLQPGTTSVAAAAIIGAGPTAAATAASIITCRSCRTRRGHWQHRVSSGAPPLLPPPVLPVPVLATLPS